MKKIIALALSLIMSFSLLPLAIVSATESEETFDVVIYLDSSKEEIVFERENVNVGVDLIFTDTIEKEGYSFVNWVNAKTGETVTFENNVIPPETAEYYAEWSINKYPLYYMVEGSGEHALYEVEYATPASDMPVPETEPVKEGYTFIEWEALPETMPAGRVNIKAVMRDNDLDAIFYAELDDTEPFEKIDLEYGNEIPEASEQPQKTGYDFNGWSIDGKTPLLDLGYMGNEDAEFYAVWLPVVCKAVFNATEGAFEDGSSLKEVATYYDAQIEFDEIPVREGYYFNGWNHEVGIMNNEDGITFEAQWLDEDDIYYTVETYEMGTDGNYTEAPSTKRFIGVPGEEAKAEYEVTEGFVLDSEKSSLNGVVKSDSSLVLKVYLARDKFELNFNVDSLITTEIYMYGEKTVAPQNPVKEGYTFIGWVPGIPETMPANDYTVTASFVETSDSHVHSEKTVVIEPGCTENGKSYVACEECGEILGEITVIPATGHKAGGWTVVIEPTEDIEGKKVKKCLDCGKVLEEAVIPALSADEDEDPVTKPEAQYSDATVSIKNNNSTTTLNYGETLRVYATARDVPQGGSVVWSIKGSGAVISKVGENMCEVTCVSSGEFVLTVTVVDENGIPYIGNTGEEVSDSQFINAKAGIIQRIIAFFKKLFGLNSIITQ